MSEQNRDTLRRHYRSARQALSQEQQTKAARELVQQVKARDICKHAKRVAIYKTNDDELSTQYLIEYLWQQKLDVFLPVIHPFSRGHLLFFRYTPDTEMRKNQYGIEEPKLDITQLCLTSDLDIIFTPLVAFDEQGNRLGMGGGFYDRTLASLLVSPNSRLNQASKNIAMQRASAHNIVKVIGLAHDIQKAQQLPRQSWDIPLPYILTPTQFYRFTVNT